MGAPDWPTMLQELNQHRARVSSQFQFVVSGGSDPDRTAVRIDLGRFWDSQAETAALTESLAAAGFRQPEEATRSLLVLRASSLVRKLDEPGRKRLQSLLPVLLSDIAAGGGQFVVLQRVLRIIEAIGQRSAYFALLQESAPARARLVELCGYGDFLAQQIASYPLLLDELIDGRVLSGSTGREDLARELALRMELRSGRRPGAPGRSIATLSARRHVSGCCRGSDRSPACHEGQRSTD